MRTSVLTRILLLLLVAAMLTACSSTPAETTPKTDESTGASSETTESTEATEATEPEPPADPDGNLYYNIEKGTTRAPGMMGMYSVNLSCNGITKSYWFKSEELVKKADTMTILGLGLNSSGVVTAVYTLEELGYSMAAENMTAAAVADCQITGTDAAGAAVTLTAAADMKIYSLVDTTAAVNANDTVIAVQNSEKKVIALFVTKRAPITGMCEHCKTEVEWTLWTASGNLPSESGHFKLDTDISLASQFQMEGATEIILDLNGHYITNTGGLRGIVMFNKDGYLAIMDSSADQTGRLFPSTEEVDRGCCLWIREGTVDLYSGTLDASQVYSGGNDSGVTVDIVTTDAVFNMYGGTILAGKCGRVEGAKHCMTGGVRVRGFFNMYGGTIQGGIAEEGAGNLGIEATGTFKMTGGTITGGTGNAATEPITGTFEANVMIKPGATYEKTGGTIEGE